MEERSGSMSGAGEKVADRIEINLETGQRVFEVDGEGNCFVDGERREAEAYKEELRRANEEMTQEGLFLHLEKTWLPRLARYGNVDGFVERCDVEESGADDEDRRRYRIYTNDHVYAISAMVKKGEHTYLGCVASARKPRAGEEHTRGNDLPDGTFNYDTWLRIVHAIVGNELVLLEKPKPGVEDEETAEQVSQEG